MTRRTTTSARRTTPAARARLAVRAHLRGAELVRRVRGRAEHALSTGADRGDVPGWVLVTLMSAGVVVVLWAVAATVLPELFEDAVRNVRRD